MIEGTETSSYKTDVDVSLWSWKMVMVAQQYVCLSLASFMRIILL